MTEGTTFIGAEHFSVYVQGEPVDLVQLCILLHGEFCGTSEGMLTAAEEREALEFLQTRLAGWKPTTHPNWSAFDEAVRSLVIATLLERGLLAAGAPQ